MGKFTNLSKIKEQAELIETLADRLKKPTYCKGIRMFMVLDSETGDNN